MKLESKTLLENFKGGGLFEFCIKLIPESTITIREGFLHCLFLLGRTLKGEQRPAALATVCFCFCEFRRVSYSGSCGEQVAGVVQSMLVFVLPLNICSCIIIRFLFVTSFVSYVLY